LLKIEQRFGRERKGQTVEPINQGVERGGAHHREGSDGARRQYTRPSVATPGELVATTNAELSQVARSS
jgi:hypothetical protein